MRPRTEALLALGGLAAVATVAALLGRSGGGAPVSDRRPSTLLAGPEGARALLEAAQRLGISVRRFRERPLRLAQLEDGTRQILVILDPSAPFSPPELEQVLRFTTGADLLAAGRRAGPLMRCFGYRVERRAFDSVRVRLSGPSPGPDDPWVQEVLVRTHEARAVDSSRLVDWGPFGCDVPAVSRREELLVDREGRVAAVRLTLAASDRQVILAGDADLFRNRVLRETAAGPWALGLFHRRYDRIVFEEYHHRFGASGSLAQAALAWSGRSPWGWAAWQLGVVGLLALCFGAVRFGPARAGITRTRRSPLEHVRALAVALSAARGHDEAVAALVRGLRRRLVPAPGLTRGDWQSWLAGLDARAVSPRARAALATLRTLTRPGQPAESVHRAAHTVEDLWQELRPSR
ncbi:MAG: DUF4350 domain-containing protein [Gemmatimonadales bacterium]